MYRSYGEGAVSEADEWAGLTTAYTWEDETLTLYVDIGPQPPGASVLVSYDDERQALDLGAVSADTRKRYRVTISAEDELEPRGDFTYNNGVVAVFFEKADSPCSALE